ncbi:MAG: hypothetical protein ACP5OU_00365, partial [Methanothrix sp.]
GERREFRGGIFAELARYLAPLAGHSHALGAWGGCDAGEGGEQANSGIYSWTRAIEELLNIRSSISKHMDAEDQWKSFEWDADEFFISYMMVVCDSAFVESTHFLIGHSVELYLKAIYAKQTNDVNVAMDSHHNIRELFELCQAGVPPFMPTFSFKGTFKELYEINNKVNRGISLNNLTEEEQEKFIHFIEHQEFYYISENLMNLKYLHSPWKGPGKDNKGKNIASIRPDPFWINFVKEAKAYLGFDNGHIKRCLDGFGCNLSPNTKFWLSKVYE